MTFEDGETVVLYKPGHQWHLMNFKAYKSVHTPDAYRLKYGDRELLVDVSEIRSMSEHNRLMLSEPWVPITGGIRAETGDASATKLKTKFPPHMVKPPGAYEAQFVSTAEGEDLRKLLHFFGIDENEAN